MADSACPGFHAARLHRRALLRAGVAALGLPALLRAGERPRAKAVVLLYQFGGPSQFETFDLKPTAPAEIRGEFQPISSKLPGVPVCELLPRTATVMDKVCLVRGVRHTMSNHNPASYYALTGRAPPIDDIRLRDTPDLFPAYGSVVDKLAPARGGMPTFVSFPHRLADGSVTPGQHAGFLGRRHDPLAFTADPNAPDFRLPELELPAGLTPERMASRRELLKLIDRQAGLLENSALARGIDENYDRAIALLTAPAVKRAFDLSAEPPAVRDRYGRTTYGQSCLLARRLVESGVKFVSVHLSGHIGGGGNSGGWDTHGVNNKPMGPILRQHLLPLTDQTLPTFLTDLDERGLLDTTLVVWAGEFGRSPRINKDAGRDHWPHCYTVLLAGGGVKRGFVFGSSDRTGAEPATEAVAPDDLAATLFNLLGIDPQTELRDALGRPMPAAAGRVLTPILS